MRANAQWRRFLRVVVGAGVMLACSAKDPPGPTAGSETHFLLPCDATCPAGSVCLCGACSTSCDNSTQCTGLHPAAQCVVTRPRIAAGSCAPLDEQAMCDLPCLVDDDCQSLGAGFACHSGFCRRGSTAVVETTDAGSACHPQASVPAEVLVLGDSLIDFSSYASQLEQTATSAGALASGEHFRVHSSYLYSMLATGPLSLSQQYATARQEGTTRLVVMDGGETDVLNDVCDSPPTADCSAIKAAAKGAEQLLQQMATDGVENIAYFFYPDPVGNDAIKARLDVLRPLIENVCGHAPVACHWIDLRPVFAGHTDYLASDGLVFSDAGAAACARSVWERLEDRCVVP